jgi:hypothetical protein
MLLQSGDNPEEYKNGPHRLTSGKICSVETSMNRSGSHPCYENLQIIISTVLIRRGNTLSGAVVFIIIGGTGVVSPFSNFS